MEHVSLKELFGGSRWVGDMFEFYFFVRDAEFHEAG